MSTKTTAAALATAKDLATLPILKKIDEKIATMKKIEETPYRTNGVYKGTDIKKEMKIETLYLVLGNVIGMHDHYAKAIARVGKKTAPQFTIEGGTLEDWTEDIKLRIAVIEQDTKLTALKTAKEKMEKFLSEEDQKRVILQELDSLLS